jgi:hypothetical protein
MKRLAARPVGVWVLVWILWTRLQPLPAVGPDPTLAKLSQWQPVRAFSTQAECERAAENRGGIGAALLEEHQLKVEVLVAVRCLPETIDPRAPRN